MFTITDLYNVQLLKMTAENDKFDYQENIEIDNFNNEITFNMNLAAELGYLKLIKLLHYNTNSI